MIYVLIVSKKYHFLNPPTQSHAYVIYEWSSSMAQGKLPNSNTLDSLNELQVTKTTGMGTPSMVSR